MQFCNRLLTGLAMLGMAGVVGCDSSAGHKFELANWSDGPTVRYAIEFRKGNGADVLIPDVRALQADDRFVSGVAYWNYIDGLNMPSNGLLGTNRFWFVIDKQKEREHRLTGKLWSVVNKQNLRYDRFMAVTTNEQSWMAWSRSNSAPTNLVETAEFLAARRSSGEEGPL